MKSKILLDRTLRHWSPIGMRTQNAARKGAQQRANPCSYWRGVLMQTSVLACFQGRWPEREQF
jgi:hypothetical protein